MASTEQAAAEALARALERRRREQGLVEAPRLRDLVDIYLAQHDGEPGSSRYRAFFQGAVQAVRNPAAHEPLKLLTSDEAMELLALASLLNRALDNATLTGGAAGA